MIKKLILFFLVIVFNLLPVFAVEPQVNYKALENFNQGMIKFKESNVNVAYDEFLNILEHDEKNDYVNIVLAGKLSDIGLFNLANKAVLLIKDTELAQIQLENIRNVYSQKDNLSQEDEIYLAEAYSNIMFNNQSKEVASEMTANTEIRERSDYANFITALAWYKSANLEAAMKYVEIAIERNPKNLSYKFLQAKILADGGNKEKALKIVENIKKSIILTKYYDLKVKGLEQYILYKTAKSDKLQSYYLGSYFYYNGDYLRAIKELPLALGTNKKENAMVYTLISQNYVALKEYEKASNNAIKSYRIDKNNPDTLMILGDLRYVKEDYKGALKYYKDAMKKEKSTYNASVKTAKTYLELDKLPKAQEILLKILRTSSDYYEAYYIIALIEPYKELAYLKKSVGINLEFVDGWLALANYELDKDNILMAQFYLNNAYNLDQNNYKYYYYQGLLYKTQKDIKNAQYNFQKSYKINPKFVSVKKELKNDK